MLKNSQRDNSRSFCINIAGVRFLFASKDKRVKWVLVRLKQELKAFACLAKRPHQRIQIFSQKQTPVYNFRRKGKTLEISLAKDILKNKLLWQAFRDKLVAKLREFVLSSSDIILLHCACCLKNKKGFLFLGPSQSGKTTIAKLTKDYLVISDERILVRRWRKKYYLSCLPLLSYESKKIHKDIKHPVPVERIFLLRKSKRVRFKRVSKAYATAYLIERIKDLDRLSQLDAEKVFDIACGIACSIPVWQMYFKKDDSFWQHMDKLK